MASNNKRSLYLVPKTLDVPSRILGLPIDEFIVGLFFAVFFFLLGKMIWSMIIPTVVVVLIKVMKRGQGSAWLVNLCYWYLPKVVMINLLRKTPPSRQREYIA